MLKKCFIGLCLQYLFTEYLTEYNRGYSLLHTSFVIKTVLTKGLKLGQFQPGIIEIIEIAPLYYQCCFGRLCLL